MEIPRELAVWLLGVLGAFVGSFLNVCIYRMPAHRSIVYPGSACPACGAPIRPWQNVPVLSWIFLRGRCASCEAPIPARYAFVEALTSALFVLGWFRFGPGWNLAHALVLLSAMIVLFFTDLDERILPDLVTLPGAALGVTFAFVMTMPRPYEPGGSMRASLLSAGAAAAAGLAAAGSLWLVGWLWTFVRPGIESAMGLGDVKMLALIGAFLGLRLTLLTVFLGSLLGTGVFVLARLAALLLPSQAPPRQGPLARGLEKAGFLVDGKGAGMLDQIPFGSLLAIGAAVALVWGERLITGYAAISLSLGDWLLRAGRG